MVRARDYRRRKASVVEADDVRTCDQEDGKPATVQLSRWLAVSEQRGFSDEDEGVRSGRLVFGFSRVEPERMNAATVVRLAKGTFDWRTSRRQRLQRCSTATSEGKSSKGVKSAVGKSRTNVRAVVPWSGPTSSDGGYSRSAIQRILFGTGAQQTQNCWMLKPSRW